MERNKMIEETINKVFDEKPSDIMKELITGYYTSYKKEVICKHRYMQMETTVEHDKLSRIDNLMNTAGLNVTTARNKAEEQLADKRLELTDIDRAIQTNRLEKKVYRLLIEYLLED